MAFIHSAGEICCQVPTQFLAASKRRALPKHFPEYFVEECLNCRSGFMPRLFDRNVIHRGIKPLLQGQIVPHVGSTRSRSQL